MASIKAKARKLIRSGMRLFKKAAAFWLDKRAARMGAAIAFQACFSTAPLLLLVIVAAGLWAGRAQAEQEILQQVSGLIGASAADSVARMLHHAADTDAGLIAGAIGLVLSTFAATSLLVEVRSSLNDIWDAPYKGESGAWQFLRNRLIGIIVILLTAILLILSLIISTVLTVIHGWLDRIAPALNWFIQIINLGSFLIIPAIMFACIFRFLPNKRLEWRDVWLGAAITSLLFSLGKGAIALYLGKSGVLNIFGAAGSLISLLIWVYYSAQIFLFGAALTRAYAETWGSLKQGGG